MATVDTPHLFGEHELRAHLEGLGFPVRAWGGEVDVRCDEVGEFRSGPHAGRQFAVVRVSASGAPWLDYSVRVFLSDVTHGWRGLTLTERLMKGYE